MNLSVGSGGGGFSPNRPTALGRFNLVVAMSLCLLSFVLQSSTLYHRCRPLRKFHFTYEIYREVE